MATTLDNPRSFLAIAIPATHSHVVSAVRSASRKRDNVVEMQEPAFAHLPAEIAGRVVALDDLCAGEGFLSSAGLAQAFPTDDIVFAEPAMRFWLLIASPRIFLRNDAPVKVVFQRLLALAFAVLGIPLALISQTSLAVLVVVAPGAFTKVFRVILIGRSLHGPLASMANMPREMTLARLSETCQRFSDFTLATFLHHQASVFVDEGHIGPRRIRTMCVVVRAPHCLAAFLAVRTQLIRIACYFAESFKRLVLVAPVASLHATNPLESCYSPYEHHSLGVA